MLSHFYLPHFLFRPDGSQKGPEKGKKGESRTPPDPQNPVRPMENIVQDGKEVLNDVLLPFYFHSLPPK